MSELLHQFLIDLPGDREQRTAMDSRHGDITYGQLRERVTRLAGWLTANGAAKNDRIAVCLPKRIPSVECILASLYMGGVYVPIDFTAPVERVKKIVEDAGAVRIFALPDMGSALAATGIETDRISVLENVDSITATDALPGAAEISVGAPADVDADDLAAFLYTSGSTGNPKGVMLSHRNIHVFSRWVVDLFSLTDEDVLSSHAPFHFDLSTMDLYSTFIAGARVYILDEVEKRFPATVTKLIQDKGITSWYSVPSALMLMEDKTNLEKRDFSALRQIFFAGEVYPLPALRKIMARLPDVRFINLYGPTETNVCTYYALSGTPGEDQQSIPIGKVCEHYTLSILDENDRELPQDEMGEICIRGPGVMKGYWRAPEKTEASRVRGLADTYRTGDYGILRADGNVDYCGRKDSQVKIQGYRVELNEIERVANSHPAVTESAAVVAEQDGFKRIYLCVATGDREADAEGIMAWCGRELPSYAVPGEILLMEAFGRTSTGKIDRQALAAIVEEWQKPEREAS
jgi:amino acid adenylation domain-containing protein